MNWTEITVSVPGEYTETASAIANMTVPYGIYIEDYAFVKKEDLSDELFEVLLGLGYKQADIKKVLSKVDATKSLENQVKEALKLMLK